jgi:hypothetical protein
MKIHKATAEAYNDFSSFCFVNSSNEEAKKRKSINEDEKWEKKKISWNEYKLAN